MEAEERLIKRVIARFRCSHCNRQHAADNVNVMGRYDDVWIIGVDCEECARPGMFVVSLRKDSSVDVVTDLTEEERARFLRAKQVAAGDVDQMREFLQQFDGDFSRIFKQAS